MASLLCRMCGEKEESECKKLAQKEYKIKDDMIMWRGLYNWKLRELHQLEEKEKWYEHVPEGVEENGKVKLLWDININ